jgi:hypothetical protein
MERLTTEKLQRKRERQECTSTGACGLPIQEDEVDKQCEDNLAKSQKVTASWLPCSVLTLEPNEVGDSGKQ